MVDFQSRDTRRGVSDDDDEAGETTETGSAPSGEAGESHSDETAETDPPDEESATQTGFAVVTVGTDRTVDQDASGTAVIDEIDAAGGHVATREVIDASYDGVQRTVESLVDRRDVSAVVTVGGTGVEPDDVTVEAVEPMLDRHLPGFGELLRILCFDDEGSTVVRTRATAGTIDGVPVFCLPGDPALSRRGVREIVVPEAEVIAELAGAETPK